MSSNSAERLRFISPELAESAAKDFGTPLYLYSEAVMREQAQQALAFNVPFGLTVRYAMKANPLSGILRLFNDLGIGVDASSGFEVERAIRAGIAPERIMLTSQELPLNLQELAANGVHFNATSLHQLEAYGRARPGSRLSVRINSGQGSGHTKTVSVAGPTSSFGIWHEHVDDITRLAGLYNLRITTVHNHIGCGADPEIWTSAAKTLLGIVDHFPAVDTINLGGGFKVARTAAESATDLQPISSVISDMLTAYERTSGRKLKVEVEPGTFLAANAGTLLARVEDIVDTGSDGLTFAKLNTGMNDFMRPALHASQHPIVPLRPRQDSNDYVVVGHNCESTDLLTPKPGQAETPLPRRLPALAIDDLVAIEGTGAYCSSMNLSGYNSFPSPNEVLITTDSKLILLKRGRNLDDLLAQELDLQTV